MPRPPFKSYFVGLFIFVLLGCGTIDSTTTRVRFVVSSDNVKYLTRITYTGADGHLLDIPGYITNDAISPGWASPELEYSRGMSLTLYVALQAPTHEVLLDTPATIMARITADGQTLIAKRDTVEIANWGSLKWASAWLRILATVP